MTLILLVQPLGLSRTQGDSQDLGTFRTKTREFPDKFVTLLSLWATLWEPLIKEIRSKLNLKGEGRRNTEWASGSWPKHTGPCHFQWVLDFSAYWNHLESFNMLWGPHLQLFWFNWYGMYLGGRTFKSPQVILMCRKVWKTLGYALLLKWSPGGKQAQEAN